jgi:hydrogenase maturation protein HypF
MFPDSELYKLELAHEVLPSLGCGGESKSSICLAAGKQAWLTPPIGDLADFEMLLRYQDSIYHLKKRLGIEPQLVVHDLHPDYASTRYAQQQPEVKLIAIHHHAHIAGCLAEYGIEQPVIGICWDGTGWGSDGHIWGGEFLLVDQRGFERRAHLAYIPLPGGEAAIREPYRMALSLLHYSFGDELTGLNLEVLRYIGRPKLNILLKMIDKGLNCPVTSSMGRLFDGLASILSIRDINRYEGEAAIALEQQAHKSSDAGIYAYELSAENGAYIINPQPLVREVVNETQTGESSATISRRFHNTLVDVSLKICRLIADESGPERVALSGGVFQNKLLVSLLVPALKDEGFEVLLPRRISPNDSGIALGQVVAANAMLRGN